MKRKQPSLSYRFPAWNYLMLGGLLLLVTVAAALIFRSPPPQDSPAFISPQLVEGKTLYDAHCAACHGFNLEGQADWQQPNPDGSFRAPPHDETGHTWHHNDAYLLEATRLGGERLPANIGVSAMPAYKNVLGDEQIMAILEYIKSTWPNEILEAQQRIPNR